VLAPGQADRARPLAKSGLDTVSFFFLLSEPFSDLNIHRNSITLLKYIENELKLRKIQNKFSWNPLGCILAIDLTQLHFVHYCHLENFYETILGVFNYKHL
jgi:hypothetical protein